MKLRTIVNAEPYLQKVFEKDFDDGLLAFRLSKVQAAMAEEVRHFVNARSKHIMQHGTKGAIPKTDIEGLQKLDGFCREALDAEVDLKIERFFTIKDIGKDGKLGPQSPATVGALLSVGLMSEGEDKGKDEKP